MNTQKQPIVFIGHGSPMNALANNFYTQTLNSFGKSLHKPKGIIMISAHWISHNSTFIQQAKKLTTLHDFYGFPQELFNFEYPVNGMPELSQLILEKLSSCEGVNPEIQEYQLLDHGAWSILTHIFPDADIPVVEISIDFNLSAQKHFEIGQSLADLANEGYLIVGSGNLVHNLRTVDFKNTSFACSQPWAYDLSQKINDLIFNKKFDELIDYNNLPYANIGINIADHYIPFLYSLGASSTHNLTPSSIYKGFELATLDMHCIKWY